MKQTRWLSIFLIPCCLIFMIFLTGCSSTEVEEQSSETAVNEETTKIAAVGDSITDEYLRGANYPERLSEKLGEAYEVGNFGRSNYAVQHDSDFTYQETTTYEESLAYEPQIVLLMMGTNDTKARNWQGPEAFKEDYTDLVESYLHLDSVSRVILASPPTVFLENVARGSIDPQYIEPIRAVVQEVADDYDLAFVDMTAQTADHPEWFFDGIHPTPEGAEQMAQIFFEEINE